MSWINDPVNSPKHYTDSHPGMECIDLTADTTFCLGNAIKYLWRYHSKGRPVEDLEKARWYLCRVIDYGEKIAWTQRQTRILTRLRGQAEANGLEHEYRIWRDLALGDTDTSGMSVEEVLPLWPDMNPDAKVQYRRLARLAITAARTEALK